MLLSEDEIQIELLYMGPTKGCRQVLCCDPLGFRRDLDCADPLKDRQAIIEELDHLAFQMFRAGTFAFTPFEHHHQAIQLVELEDRELIEQMYPESEFLRQLAKLELEKREILNIDIYRIGLYGNQLAREQAVSMMQRLNLPCSICQCQITLEEEFAQCPECHGRFHDDCIEGGGGHFPDGVVSGRTLWSYIAEEDGCSWKHPDLLKEEEIKERWYLAEIEEEMRRVITMVGTEDNFELVCHTGPKESGIPGAYADALDRADRSGESGRLFHTLLIAAYHAVLRERSIKISRVRISIGLERIGFEYHPVESG